MAGSARINAIDSPFPRSSQAWTMVAVLLAANTFSFVDRQILSLLIDPIRRDLTISDVQVSLLIGPAFAVFFCLAALPIGRLVDTRTRVRVAAAGIALWSLATILGGFADSYADLFMARVGVAVGEAALFPAAHALIADSFPPSRRARATGVFVLAISLGGGLAFVFGGAIIGWAERGGPSHLSSLWAGLHPWQVVLMLVGAPGLLIAGAMASLREPPRRDGGSGQGPGARIPFGAVMAAIRRDAGVFATLFFSFATFAMAGYAVLAWAPTHLTRELGFARSATGLWVGLAVIAGGLSGIAIATTLADRSAAAGVAGAKYRIAAGSCVAGAVLAVLLGVTADPAFYIVELGLLSVCTSTGFVLGPVALHEITPGAMRGQALAIFQIVATIVGAGLGPPIVALVAKRGAGIGGGLSIVAAVTFTAGAIGFVAGRHRFAERARVMVTETLATAAIISEAGHVGR